MNEAETPALRSLTVTRAPLRPSLVSQRWRWQEVGGTTVRIYMKNIYCDSVAGHTGKCVCVCVFAAAAHFSFAQNQSTAAEAGRLLRC